MRVSALCLAVLLGLAACSSIKTYDVDQGQMLSQQQLMNLHKWELNGRLLIKSDEILTANIQWQHNRGKDIVKLSGTLGIGAIQIELDDNEIVLDAGKGETGRSQDIDAFIARQVGFVVPITALRLWVLGAHLSGEPVYLQEDGFQQLGWRITYIEYMPTSVGMMPRRIKITKEHMKLKLVIDQWEIE